MGEINLGNFFIPSWIVLPLIFLAWVMTLVSLKKIVFVVARRFTRKTGTRLDDIFLKSVESPLTLIIFASGGIIIEYLSPTGYFPIVFKAVLILALIIFVERFFSNIVYEYSGKVEILRSSGGIVRGIMRVGVIGLGLLVLLDSFGISVTPVLASLGIGSLAVALALQPTLENFFAGIQIIIDKPIQIGHFVKLESGEEGYVYKIGWRSTWIKLLSDSMVIIPNKNLVNAKITNYYYPEAEVNVVAEVRVHYQSDLEKVEKVTLEVAKEALQESAAGIKNFQPLVAYHTFGDLGIHFSVHLRAREFSESSTLKHSFMKKLHGRYKMEGIVIRNL